MPSHIPNLAEPFGGDYLSKTERAEFAESIRALADWIETSEFPIPRHTIDGSPYFTPTLTIPSMWIHDGDFVRRVGSAARLIGGKVDKSTEEYGPGFILTRSFGCGVHVRYQIERSAVCERVETTVIEEVEEEVPVDAERAADVERRRAELQAELDAIETTTVKVPREVPKVEYICPPSLLLAEKGEETPDIKPASKEPIPF